MGEATRRLLIASVGRVKYSSGSETTDNTISSSTWHYPLPQIPSHPPYSNIVFYYTYHTLPLCLCIYASSRFGLTANWLIRGENAPFDVATSLSCPDSTDLHVTTHDIIPPTAPQVVENTVCLSQTSLSAIRYDEFFDLD